MRIPFTRSSADAGDTGDEAAEMTLLGHLTELRKRLIWSVAAILLGTIVVFALHKQVLETLEGPYCEFIENADSPDLIGTTANAGRCGLLTTGPVQAFSVVLTVSGYGGLLLALPVVLYQLGRFVMPGLYPNEKRMLIPFVVVSLILLSLGAASAWILMPRTLGVLQSFGTDSFVALYTPEEYYSFFVKMVLAFGLAAELPLILVFLQLVGVVKPDQLASNRRIAIVAVTVLGAVITPTGDPFNLAIVTVPMYLFYELAILIGRLLLKRRASAGSSGAEVAG